MTTISLPHSRHCDGTNHVQPVGFREGLPWDGSHGEPYEHQGIPHRCMCGHVDYYSCPEWILSIDLNDACDAGNHGECDRTAVVHEMHEDNTVMPDMCPCDCHAVTVVAVTA